jgi:branched-subunit amino acid transport protein
MQLSTQLSPDNVWLAIILMGAVTWLARSLPFWFSGQRRWLQRLADPSSPLAALGPCLLVAMMAATVLPMLSQQVQIDLWHAVPTLVAMAAVLLTMKIKPNVGLAVVLGMVTYPLVVWLVGR